MIFANQSLCYKAYVNQHGFKDENQELTRANTKLLNQPWAYGALTQERTFIGYKHALNSMYSPVCLCNS